MKFTKKHGIMFGVVLLSFIIAGCSSNTDQDPAASDNNTQEITEETAVVQWEILATVNGQAITSAEVATMQELFAQQGQQISSDDALEQVINQIILTQQVTPLSTTETESMIEAQLSLQGVTLDDYREQIEAQGMSYDAEIENAREGFAVQTYVESTVGTEFEVTDAEARAFYDEYSQQSPEELPPYEELEEQIIMTVQQQKQQEAVQAHIQELRADADIQYN